MKKVMVCVGLVVLMLMAACMKTPKSLTTIPSDQSWFEGRRVGEMSERPWNAPRPGSSPNVSAPTLSMEILTDTTTLGDSPTVSNWGFFGNGRAFGTTPQTGSGGVAGAPITPARRMPRLYEPVKTSAPRPVTYRQSGLRYSQAEELWIITREVAEARGNEDEFPGTGALMTRVKEAEVPLPLRHTDVKAAVDGYIASVNVRQQFANPYDSKIEAMYVFPLPENSAVNEFLMVIGKRQIRGIVREREEATKIYEEARAQGYTASLMTQERPNIFTQKVANIEPGKQIDVTITYYNTLAYMDGWFEFAFPMVVGPRFNPAGSTKGVGAVPRGQQGRSGQATEVSYLRPGERSGHDIDLELSVNAGVAIEEFESVTHKITTSQPSAERVVAKLAAGDRVPNKDFVFRFRVAGGEIKSGLIASTDARGGFFTMMIYPPAGMTSLKRHAMELVFVLDCSGSMSGRPLAQAKAAAKTALEMLQPIDSFQVINFSMTASQLGSEPLEATPDNIRRGVRYLEGLESEGGTMMIEGIKGALDFKHDPKRLRFVCFLTDGYIGNEAEILEAIEKKLGDARIFSFGVGSSVNRYLLDSMARVGRGAVAYLLPQTESAPVMRDFFERISHPALADVKIDWRGMDVRDVYPKRLPDLYAGRPILVTGRFKGEVANSVMLSAKNGETKVSFPVSSRAEKASPALASIWARSKIRDSKDAGEIKKTALDFSLLSQFTAFVAVDSSRRTAGEEGTTVPVAVPVPEGVKYRTTVGER